MQADDKTTPPNWQIRTLKLGRLVFGLTRAISGEWASGGKVRRLALIRSKKFRGWFLLAGPWCLTVARV